MDSPFLRPYSPQLPDVVTDGAVHILGGRGVDRFSIRALARWMGVHPSTLLGEFSRARLLEIIVVRFADRWLEWAAAADSEDGPGILRLPETPDERLGVRVRLDLAQLAEAERLRDEVAPAVQLSWLRGEEHKLVEARLRAAGERCCPPVVDEVVLTHLLIDGLRRDLAAEPPSTVQPLTLSRAQMIISSHVAAITAHRVDCPLTAAAG